MRTLLLTDRRNFGICWAGKEEPRMGAFTGEAFAEKVILPGRRNSAGTNAFTAENEEDETKKKDDRRKLCLKKGRFAG